MKILKKRRRFEGKTNYSQRVKSLSGGRPRIVIRRTNKYVIIQYVESHEAKDKVIIGLTSSKLIDYGWPKEWKGSLTTIPASYLTGMLMGKMMAKGNHKGKPIIDLGVQSTKHFSSLYAAIKGLADAGVQFPHDKKALPPQERIIGSHIKKDVENVLNNIKNSIEKKHG